ncbi:hypothetical protein GCM10023115_39400 [Pontixanthobacter gangjinensis]|uniref:Uncharacterized protein n=1 Tax=Christiangramia aestuarii TaxID=1028746 RepID=A0A7K1LTE9_9FLAO|nr:hypothetical protein [Christiangramia aestuarii]MUP43871.1 hypothetical protein [Christiangramia aestuarii]
MVLRNFFLLIILFGSLTYGQNITSNNQLYVVSNYGVVKNIPEGQLRTFYAKGSPYHSDDFKNGKIINTETLKEENARLRYDILYDRIQIRIGNTSKYRFLPKRKDIAYVIGGSKFIYGEYQNEKGKKISGYFEEIYINDNLKLLGVHKVDIIPAKLAVTGYEKPKKAELVQEKHYYIMDLDGKVKEVKLKKNNIRNVLNHREVDDYLDSNKIKNENDLIRLLEILNS